jgi:hypothetical protein
MAGSAAIGHVSQSLKEALKAAFTDAGPYTGTGIDLRSPKAIGTPAGGVNTISLWLYRVHRFDDLENVPPRISANGRLIPPPLPLMLHYLLTPMSADEVTAQRLLGHAMQALGAQSRLGPEFTHPELNGETDVPIGIHLEQLSFDDTARVWQALHEPYRLSVPYFAQYVAIESSRSLEAAAPVVDRNAGYQQELEVQ